MPLASPLTNEEEIMLEKKKNLVNTLLNTDCGVKLHLNYFYKYSKRVRMVAWIYRFIYNSKTTELKKRGELLVEEIEVPERFLHNS